MPIDAHINNGGARLHHLRRDESRPSDRRHQNVRLARHCAQVARLRVANRHRGILVQQQHRHRLAHNVAAPHNNRMLPR